MPKEDVKFSDFFQSWVVDSFFGGIALILFIMTVFMFLLFIVITFWYIGIPLCMVILFYVGPRKFIRDWNKHKAKYK